MKVNIGMGVAVLAIVISIAAIVSTVIVKPVSTISANSVGGNELADSSVTSGKVADGTLTDDDISDTGISKIADNAITSDHITASSITLSDLSSEVIAAIKGVVDIANNSIKGANIVDGTITTVDIADSAINSDKIENGAVTTDQLASDVSDQLVTNGDSHDHSGGDGAPIPTEGIASGAITQVVENAIRSTVTTTTFWDPLPDTTVEITTDANPVLIIFSGSFSSSHAGGHANVQLQIDGANDPVVLMYGESSNANDRFVLSFNRVSTLTAGAHTIRVTWTVGSPGETATCYNRIIDVIELKR